MSCFFSASLKWRKFFLTPSASPRCRKIASSNVSECLNVAGCTPDLIEQDRPLLCVGRVRQLRISRRRLRGSHKTSEAIDIGQAVRSRGVFWIWDRVAQRGHFGGHQTAGDAHFVEVGVSGERQQAGMLILPAKSSNPIRTGCFKNGNRNRLAANFAM